VQTLFDLLHTGQIANANDRSTAYNLLGAWYVYGCWSPAQAVLAQQLIDRANTVIAPTS
jgi:hypothetical protein